MMMCIKFTLLPIAVAIGNFEPEFEDSALSLLQLRASSKQGIVNRQECEDAARSLGLELGKGAFAFEGAYSVKGCYAYQTGSYACHAFYGTSNGGDVTEAEAASPVAAGQTRLGGLNQVGNCPLPARIVGQDECEDAARSLGLEMGKGAFAFAGAYSVKGCYAYQTGAYGCTAFYGTSNGGDASYAEAGSPVAAGQTRLDGLNQVGNCPLPEDDEAEAIGDPHLTTNIGDKKDLCCESGECRPCSVALEQEGDEMDGPHHGGRRHHHRRR